MFGLSVFVIACGDGASGPSAITAGSSAAGGVSVGTGGSIRIDPTATTTSASNAAQLSYAKIAAAKRVTVWASPWAPIAAWQTNFGIDASGNAKLQFNFAYVTQWVSAVCSLLTSYLRLGFRVAFSFASLY